MTDVPTVRCRVKRCNRVLRDPESIARGIGPVCEGRERWSLARREGYSPPPRRGKRKRPGQPGPDLLDMLREVENG